VISRGSRIGAEINVYGSLKMCLRSAFQENSRGGICVGICIFDIRDAHAPQLFFANVDSARNEASRSIFIDHFPGRIGIADAAEVTCAAP
jgi:hypothetical protein